ncbi:M61 family metallopeptidase [Fluviicola taffensis]|uniref:Peptidase M61 domain protein n=1 Tax=Fluviicola taffensis (strain DSM 16823 / NCIMB 13979 / RW262) TaxID=755732 RepID=F2IKJ0_FLUTR|nr:PDZ domain-containing protein [Fluviicola taffensis]AEA45116.1 peptidase M61 domain protein [Fluviicola taffensis DSM 16823]
MKSVLLLLSLGIVGILNAQKIHYNLGMSKPQNHYFEVEMEISEFKATELTVKMPVWAPGSYLVREFSKNVNLVRAFDEKGAELKVGKTSKNAWKITTGKAKKVNVQYEVYAFELSVRTSFLDLTHGFVSSSGVFCYLDGYKDKPGTITVQPYKDFKVITTPLEKAEVQKDGEGAQTFQFPNYDILVDSPFEIGNQEVFSFKVGETNHRVALYGGGNYDIDELKVGMSRIITAENDVFAGKNPNKNYTFIVHNVVNGQGGLEHLNSCVLSVNRWTYGNGYKDFLSLVAHEYFHLWNVKRIRPIQLGPFNYDEENYTSLLWVMEGFTSYYDELLLVRAGYYTKEEYLRKLQGTLNYVEGSVGSRVQPVAHSSYDAWIKGYRPNENSANTTMTYYSRGGILAAYLDATIIDKFNGSKCLDHFMQYLYEEFYIKKNRGFTEQEFQDALEKFLGQDMDYFFDKYVNGTEIPNYQEVFAKIGLDVTYTGKSVTSFGASLSQEGGNCIVKSIRAGSSAESAGLSVGDEVLAADNQRVDNAALESYIAGIGEGETCKLLIARDELVMELTMTMSLYERPSFKLTPIGTANAKFDYWLRAI